MSRLFISHSSVDNAIALAVGQWLEARGWSDYFLDIDESRGIAPGERWMAALAAAVDRCEAVVFLLSPAWRRSQYCFAEFFEAKKLGKRIFGVIVEPIALAELPEQMTAEWQVCDLSVTEDADAFTVERVPMVPRTQVHLSRSGLEALCRGLQKAGLDASTFAWPPPREPGRAPYPGLRALDEEDAAVFFGRDAAIVRAMDQFRLVRERGVESLFVVLGASGAGKSSFLRAGLLPRLRRDAEHVAVLPVVRPQGAAISGPQGLLASLQQGLREAGRALGLADLRAELEAGGLPTIVSRIARGADGAPARPGAAPRTVVLPVDQAEELLAADGQAEASAFLAWMGAPAAGLIFLLTIRSDSLPRLQARSELQASAPVLLSLPAMPPGEFKAVIEGPAARHTEAVRPLTIAPELTEELMADAQGADALPLLALSLEWLYREFTTGDGTRLGLEQYRRLGGVRGVIGVAVERALARPGDEPAVPATPHEREALLARLFPHLAIVDPDSGQWKRRVAGRAALARVAPQAEAMVSRLVDQRLLLADTRAAGEGAPAEVVEVAHEALLRQWDLLAGWLQEFAEALASIEAVRRATADWDRHGRDEALLVHTAHRLRAAQELQSDARVNAQFEAAQRDYLSACEERDRRVIRAREEQLQAVAEAQARRASAQRRFFVGLSVFACVVLGLLVWIVRQAREVGTQTSHLLAGAAETAADAGRYDQSLRLAALAVREGWLRPAHPTAAPALVRAADGNTLRLLLAGHTDMVGTAQFSPDGTRVVTASEDGSARLWDARTGRPVGVPMKHAGWLRSAVFAPDGRRVATASEDRSARVWDGATGRPVTPPLVHAALVRSVAFSPDGTRVVTASGDGTARVWDAATGQPVGAPMVHGGLVYDAEFSPDGRSVVTASADRSARLWDAATGAPLGQPLKHDGWVGTARFSPDGRRILTASGDQTARVWDAATLAPVGMPMTHGAWIRTAAFSPDGSRVITASGDRTARLWDASTGLPVGDPMRHDDAVLWAEFSPDGARIVTASEDRSVRLWDGATGRPLGEPLLHGWSVRQARFSADGKRIVTAASDWHARVFDAGPGRRWADLIRPGGEVLAIDIRPDGRRILTASSDGTVRAWDAATGEPAGPPMTHDGALTAAAFSPDGHRVATASADRSARLWDADTGQLQQALHHAGRVRSVRFSADGRWVLTASDDGTARVWNAADGQPRGAPLRHVGIVYAAAFSPDGATVVTASADGTARLWRADTGAPVGEAMKHESKVYDAVFSADGARVLTASEDRTARVWNAATGRPIGSPMRHRSWVRTAAFSADGERVVTASGDRTARLWAAATGLPLGEPMTHDGRVYAAAFSADGRRVVTASEDRTARVWDAATGKPMGAPLAHDGEVLAAMFSRDGRRVATSSRDGTARVWALDWSALAGPEALLAGACARLNADARRLTTDDLRLAKVLAPARAGEDVCAGVRGVVP